jgi:type IV pilus assembly protein PilW
MLGDVMGSPTSQSLSSRGTMNAALSHGHRHRGVTLIELLVGLALGLLIVAAALAWLATSLHEQRRLALEGRLTQDLRAAVELMARELRRAGYWGAATAGVATFGAGTPRSNPYAALDVDAATGEAVAFRYSRDALENDLIDGHEESGLRLRRNVLELQLGAGNWQALTDPAVLTVTSFRIRPQLQELSLEASCTRPCPVGSGTCPPRLQVRSLALAVTGRSASDPRVQREVLGNVRLRNDTVGGACPE